MAHPPAAALVCVAGVWPGTKETRLIARRGGDRLGPRRRHTIARGSIDFLAAVARRPSSPAPLQVIVVNVVVAIVVGIGRRGGEGDIVASIGQGGKETSTPPPAVARGGWARKTIWGGRNRLSARSASMSARRATSMTCRYTWPQWSLRMRPWCAALSLLSLFFLFFGRGHA